MQLELSSHYLIFGRNSMNSGSTVDWKWEGEFVSPGSALFDSMYRGGIGCHTPHRIQDVLEAANTLTQNRATRSIFVWQN